MDQFFFFADHFGVATAVMIVLGVAFYASANKVATFMAPLIVQHFDAASMTASTVAITSAHVTGLISRIDDAIDTTRFEHADLAHLIKEAKFAAEEARIAATKAAKTSEQILDLIVGVEANEPI